MKFRFKMQRVEVRAGEMDVEAESFEVAAATAARMRDNDIPRKAQMRVPFSSDTDPAISFAIISGREL